MKKMKKLKTELEKLVAQRQEMYKQLDSKDASFEESTNIINQLNKDIITSSRKKAKELADEVDKKTLSIIKNREQIEKDIKKLTSTRQVVEETISNIKEEKLLIILLKHPKYTNINEVVKVLKRYEQVDGAELIHTVEEFIKKVKEQKTKKHSIYDWDEQKFLLKQKIKEEQTK